MSAASIYIPRVRILVPSCLSGRLSKIKQVDLTQTSLKLLLLPWVLEHVRFCVVPLRVESLVPTAMGTLAFKAKRSGAYFPGTGPLA